MPYFNSLFCVATIWFSPLGAFLGIHKKITKLLKLHTLKLLNFTNTFFEFRMVIVLSNGCLEVMVEKQEYKLTFYQANVVTENYFGSYKHTGCAQNLGS